MRRFLAMAGILALAACADLGPLDASRPATVQTSAPSAPVSPAATGCAAEARASWRPLNGGAFAIRAETSGENCAGARATITITGPGRRVLYAETYDLTPMRSTVFAGADTPEAMRTALAAWIDPAQNTTMLTTGALPEWPADAAQPANGEFPFYPEDGMTRETYAHWRAADRPLYCFVQGGESSACLALDPSGRMLTKIGVQSFPG